MKFTKTMVQAPISLLLLCASFWVFKNPEHHKLGIPIVGMVDIYLFTLLVIAAFRSDTSKKSWDRNWQLKAFPTRFFGIFLLIGFFFTIVFSFAAKYLFFSGNLNPSIESEFDAFYFSFLTTTTLGYGEISPTATNLKQVLMFQIVTAINLLLFAFALLISRLSNMRTNKV